MYVCVFIYICVLCVCVCVSFFLFPPVSFLYFLFVLVFLVLCEISIGHAHIFNSWRQGVQKKEFEDFDTCTQAYTQLDPVLSEK